MTPFAFIAPATARNVLLVLVGGCYLGYHLYHLWRRRAEKKRNEGVGIAKEETGKRKGQMGNGEGARDGSEDSEVMAGRGVPSAPQSSSNEAALSPDCGGQGTDRPAVSPAPQPIRQSDNPTIQQFTADLSGEELYAQARAMPHQAIPDNVTDGEYLKLLAQSAEKGYPRALAKLGDYAMRRGCNVEAYYWLWRARKAGMGGLDRTLLQVRSVWANAGFEREIENEHEFFTHEQGTIGYALLCIDARHNANAAKAWLAGSRGSE